MSGLYRTDKHFYTITKYDLKTFSDARKKLRRIDAHKELIRIDELNGICIERRCVISRNNGRVL